MCLTCARFHQLFPRYATLLRRIRLHETAIDRQVVPLHQSDFQTTRHDLFKQLLEQFRLLKSSVPILRERGVMWNLLVEAQTGEPAPGQMHAQFLHQLPLAGDAVQVADQQDAQQKLGINRGPTGLTVAVFQLRPYKLKT